jgi:hypothetical protein
MRIVIKCSSPENIGKRVHPSKKHQAVSASQYSLNIVLMTRVIPPLNPPWCGSVDPDPRAHHADTDVVFAQADLAGLRQEVLYRRWAVAAVVPVEISQIDKISER